MPEVDVLLPTCNRADSLVMALAGLAGQSFSDIRVIVSDQSREPVCEKPVPQSLARVIQAAGGAVEWHHRVPSRGIAEQRHFLLSQSSSPYVLYLDDDVFMQPWVLDRLLGVLKSERCGFAGAFPTGLSFVDDIRPRQQVIEYWEGPVQPEAVEPGSEAWERAQLHRAANLYHVARSLPAGVTRRYKVAWIACCILYDREKLLEVGGFGFWSRLPRFHSGEEVLVQNLLMRRWGGCAIIPSGTFHSELPSTVLNDQETVDGHALDLLPDMIRRYVPSPGNQPKQEQEETLPGFLK
jgi:GT2 family glycosyltransferase